MKTLITLACALCFSTIAAAATLEDDVNRYAQITADGQPFNLAAMESFAWAGVADPRVFDPIERRVLASAAQGRTDKNSKTETSYSIRALGFSGLEKYRPTLTTLTTDRNYGHYAKTALIDLPNYQRWNPIIANRAAYNPAYSDEVNRFLIMLRSDDFDLKKLGAKRVYFDNKDPVLLEELAVQVRANFKISNEPRSDAIAWLVKALGSAKQPKYRPLLEEVVVFTNDRKVAKYAKLALEEK